MLCLAHKISDRLPNASISEPTTLTTAQVSHANQADVTKQAAPQSTVPVVKDRQQLISRLTKQPAELFDPRSWAPPPKPVPQVILQPPPPTAPPMPFAYLGKQKEGGEWVVFLKRGNATFIVKPLDIVETAYRVEAIAPPSMTLIYLPLNQRQTLLIE
jgi:hypothetical protein